MKPHVQLFLFLSRLTSLEVRVGVGVGGSDTITAGRKYSTVLIIRLLLTKTC